MANGRIYQDFLSSCKFEEKQHLFSTEVRIFFKSFSPVLLLLYFDKDTAGLERKQNFGLELYGNFYWLWVDTTLFL